MSSPDHVLTPTQLNTLARNLLEDSFPSVWVEGELGNVTRPASGHLYFTLKDAGAQVRAAMASARVLPAIFRRYRQSRCAHRLRPVRLTADEHRK